MCFGSTIYLVFDIRRFRCPKCPKVFTESLDSITFNQQYTRRFEQMVYQECLSQTFQDVAKKLDLCFGYRVARKMNWHTIKRIFYGKACERFQYTDKQIPQVLGVDEISSKKGHKQYLLAISDLQRKCVIEVLPNRLKETLVNWLYSLPVWVQNYRFCYCFSVACPEGERGDVHTCVITEVISREAFEASKAKLQGVS